MVWAVLFGLYYAAFTLLSFIWGITLLGLDLGVPLGWLIALGGVAGAVAVGVGGAMCFRGRARVIGGTLLTIGGVLGGGADGQIAYAGGSEGLTVGGNYLFGVILLGGIPIASGLSFLADGLRERKARPA